METTEFELVGKEDMEKAIVAVGITGPAALSLKDAFSGFFERAEEWRLQAAAITTPELARPARLALRKIRTEAENKRKELKEDSLRMGKAIDGANNILLALIEPIEKGLEDIEKQEERRLEAARQELKARRQSELQPYVLDVAFYNVLPMSEEEFQELLKNSKAAFVAKQEEARRIEAERAKAERERAAEEARLKAENEQLKKEADEREARAKLDRERAEQDRKAAEAAAQKEREALEAKAKVEREAREKLEREAKEREQADARKAKEESDRLETLAKAPDKEQLLEMADGMGGFVVHLKMKTEAGRDACARLAAKWDRLRAEIRAEAGKL